MRSGSVTRWHRIFAFLCARVWSSLSLTAVSVHVQRRGEPSVQKIGIVADGYVLGFPHADYGPDNEAQFRQVLMGRFGVAEEEAMTCGL